MLLTVKNLKKNMRVSLVALAILLFVCGVFSKHRVLSRRVLVSAGLVAACNTLEATTDRSLLSKTTESLERLRTDYRSAAKWSASWECSTTSNNYCVSTLQPVLDRGYKAIITIAKSLDPNVQQSTSSQLSSNPINEY
jgi:hypothetical protein